VATFGGVIGELTILTGPPATGKTTVAEVLAGNAPGPTVHLVTDGFFRSIRTGFVLPFLPEAAAQNDVVVDAIVATATTFARGNYDVVVDGIVGPWFLPPFRAAVEREQLTLSYVVLRSDLDVTLDRARRRLGNELKDVGAITGLHSAFADLGELERHVIDTSDLNIDATVAAVRRAITSREYRLS
jgi:cytidylate kinase